MTFYTRSGLSPPVWSSDLPFTPWSLEPLALRAANEGRSWRVSPCEYGWRAWVDDRAGPIGATPYQALRLALGYGPHPGRI